MGPQTLKAYGDGVRMYLDWCEANNADPMTRPALNLWISTLLDGGAAASTARSRQLAVRRFSSRLTDENEIPAVPGRGVFQAGRAGHRTAQ